VRRLAQEMMQTRHDRVVGGQGRNWGGLRYENRMSTPNIPGMGDDRAQTGRFLAQLRPFGVVPEAR
jgi:hypothetical protein